MHAQPHSERPFACEELQVFIVHQASIEELIFTEQII